MILFNKRCEIRYLHKISLKRDHIAAQLHDTCCALLLSDAINFKERKCVLRVECDRREM